MFYIFLFSQLLNFLGVFAEKLKESSSVKNPVNWQKVEEQQSKPLKNIIWKSYKGDENYFKKENKEGFSINQFSLEAHLVASRLVYEYEKTIFI